MPLLFSYGTLQQEEVQRSTLGRRLEGEHDELTAYEATQVAIEDPAVAARLGRTHHANVNLTANEKIAVPGMVFEVTDEELTRIDAYEAAYSYRRTTARLASGKEAWVYVHT